MATKFYIPSIYRGKLLGTILILGLLFGSLIGGVLGDTFGRKKACFLAMALIVPVTVGAGHVQSYNGN